VGVRCPEQRRGRSREVESAPASIASSNTPAVHRSPEAPRLSVSTMFEGPASTSVEGAEARGGSEWDVVGRVVAQDRLDLASVGIEGAMEPSSVVEKDARASLDGRVIAGV
jgi:hypothetical protein